MSGGTVLLTGIGRKAVSVLGDASLAYDPLFEDGHEKAGWAALSAEGSSSNTLKLAEPNDIIMAVLSHVEADGTVVAYYKGFNSVRQGDAALVLGVVAVGDARAAGITGNGYVKTDASDPTAALQATGNRSWSVQFADATIIELH